MQRESASSTFTFGDPIPHFALQSTSGEVVTNENLRGAPASLVVFSCNHCPYVIGSEKMLFDTIRDFQGKGLRAVLISANDPVQYPEDSFEKMKEKFVRDSMPCPYLYDEHQVVAKAFDAQCTPECFLFDGQGRLVFHGTVNNSPRYPEMVEANFLKTALEQLFSGKTPDPQFVHPIGCSIKWKVSI